MRSPNVQSATLARSPGGKRHCRARFAVNPPSSADHPVCRPKNNHQKERQHGSHEPPPEYRVDKHALRPVIGGADNMTKTQLGIAVQTDKQIDHHSDDHQPGAPGSSRNESLSDIDETPKPENLAGYKHQEQGKEDQLETAELVGTCDQERNTSKDQQQNDRAAVNDDA